MRIWIGSLVTPSLGKQFWLEAIDTNSAIRIYEIRPDELNVTIDLVIRGFSKLCGEQLSSALRTSSRSLCKARYRLAMTMSESFRAVFAFVDLWLFMTILLRDCLTRHL
jgi:hypothetical protein